MADNVFLAFSCAHARMGLHYYVINLVPRGRDPFGQKTGIATSGQVQFRKSAIHGLPVTLRMPRVKSDKSDWFWSQSIVFTKSIQNRNVVEPGQRSRFLVLTKRSAASGYENDSPFDPKRNFC